MIVDVHRAQDMPNDQSCCTGLYCRWKLTRSENERISSNVPTGFRADSVSTMHAGQPLLHHAPLSIKEQWSHNKMPRKPLECVKLRRKACADLHYLALRGGIEDEGGRERGGAGSSP